MQTLATIEWLALAAAFVIFILGFITGVTLRND